MQEDSQRPAHSELPRCKRSQTAPQDQFSHCANFPNESHNGFAKLTPCSNSSTQATDSRQHHGGPCSTSEQDCNSSCSPGSCCTSRKSTLESMRAKKRHIIQQTKSGRSWQARCSNFIINLPVTFTEKIFGPRTNCEASKNIKRTICDDDSRTNEDQSVPKKTPKPSSRDRSNKKSVQSRVSSLADHDCHKNVGTDSVFLEKANQIDHCYPRISKSVQEVVPCESSIWKSEKSTTTCNEVTDECSQSYDNSFPRMEMSENYSNDIYYHRGSKLHESRFKRGAKDRMSSSMSEGKTRGKCSVRFSSWPTILSEKLFGLRDEKVMRCCVIDNEAKLAKEMNRVADISEIVSEAGSSSPAKKGRLMLKKYTISQTPEAVEETLCFEIFPGEQLAATRTKLHTQASIKMTSNNRKKLTTIQERNEGFEKCFGAGRSHTSKRCVKSNGNVDNLNSRKMQQLEKKAPIKYISLSSLIMKFVNRYRDDKNVCNENKCHRDIVSGQRRNKRAQHDRKCAFKHRTKMISRKYAATSIHKHGNKSIKRLKYVGRGSRENKAVSCSLEQNVSLVSCTNDFPKVSGEDETQRPIPSDFSRRRKQGLQRGIARTYCSEDNLDDVRDLCKKVTQIMIRGHTDRLEGKSSNVENSQRCDSCKSSEEKNLMESRVSDMIRKSGLQEPEQFCCTALHQKRPEPKSDMRKKYPKRIGSPKKFTYKVKNRNRIEYNYLQSPCRKQCDGEMVLHQKKTVEEESCTQSHQDISVYKKGFQDYRKSDAFKLGNCGNNESSSTCMQERLQKRYHREQSPVRAKVYNKKLIFRENYTSDTARDKNSQILVEGTRRMFVIAGENIRVKMFDNRETCTDDLPGTARCQSWKCFGEQRRSPTLLHSQTTLDENIQDTKNCSSQSQNIAENRYTNLTRNSESRDTRGCNSQSESPKKGPLLDQNDKSGLQKQSENRMRMKSGCEKCIKSPCKDNARSIYPAEVAQGEDIPEDEQDAREVFSSLGQKACGERGIAVCEGETCLDEALNKSETKGAPEILNDDQFCRSENMDVHSSLEVNDCLPSVAASKVCGAEEERDSTNDPSDKITGISNNEELLDINPEESVQSDRVHLNIHSSEKRSSWITSPGKNLEVTKPESRNIINSYYSQRKSIVVSGREARNDEYTKVKKGKVQREGSASDKSTTKARRPFRQIENARQVGCTANVVIKNDKGKKLGTGEKENSNIKKKTQYSQGESISDNNTKNYLIQYVITDNSSLPRNTMAIRTTHAPSMQKLTKTESANPKTHTQMSEVQKKSKPSMRNKTFERVPGSTTNPSERSSTKLKENSCKSLLKKGNNGTTGSTADAKGTAKKIGKTTENAESESSNRLRKSIDTCDTKDRERDKKLEMLAYDKENVKVQNLQIEMSSVGEQVILNGTINKGTSWIAKGSRSSKSSKSLSLQRNGEHREGGESCNSAGAKEPKENKQTKKNQSKSETASKKNEKDKKSTPLKLLSQIDSKIDASNSTQESVTTNADLFAGALMDGKNNIKSYRDLQSAGKENSNFNRISTSRDEGLRKSGTATTQSKSKVLNSSEDGETSAKKTSGENKNEKKFRNFQGSASKTPNIAGKDRTEHMLETFPGTNNIGNINKGLTANSGLDKANVAGHSIGADVHNRGSSGSKKTSNRERNFEPLSSARSSKEVKHLEPQHWLAKKSKLKKNSFVVADCNFETSCIPQTLENAALPKNSSKEKSSGCISKNERNTERLSVEARVSPCRKRNRTHDQSVSPRANLDSDRKTKHGAHADILRLGSLQYKSREDKSASKSNYAEDGMKNLDKTDKKEIYCGTKSDNMGNATQDAITNDEIEDCLVPKARCEKSMGSECNSTELKRLRKSFQNSSNEKQMQIAETTNHPHEVKTSYTSRRMSSNKHFCFTEDLRRFLDQGQEFFTHKRRKHSNQETLCSDSNEEPSPCGSFESNDSEVCCKTTEFCKSVEHEVLVKPLKICAEGQTSNNSISSLQKAYSTLKTILSRTKNVKKGFMKDNQSKETQTYTHTPINKSRTLIEESTKPLTNEKSP